jgi:hypothetical protein
VINKWLQMLDAPLPKTIITEPIDEPIVESPRALSNYKFDCLLEVPHTISLINEQLDPPPLSARQKAEQRWRCEVLVKHSDWRTK